MQIVVEVPMDAAPALRALVNQMSESVGERLQYPMGDASGQAKKTAAFTNAAIALGALRAAVNKAIPKSDPYLKV